MANKRWAEYGHVVEEINTSWGKAVFVDNVEVDETFNAAIGRIMAEESLKKLLKPKDKQ